MSKVAVVVCLSAMAAASAPRALKPQGLQQAASRWNQGSVEQTQALKLKGDVARGQQEYQVCVGCHQADGAGQADGVFPRLAGQHPSVLIKQLADIRIGRRDVPIMYPFASTIGGPQAMADLAAYISTLKPANPPGRGPGTAGERGHLLYVRDCAPCHGLAGEGSNERFYPRLEGQHYRYLLRQLDDLRTGARRNANPDMLKMMRGYSTEDLQAVTDYIAGLGRPAPEARR